MNNDKQIQDSILVPGWHGIRAPQSAIPVAVAEASFSTISISDVSTARTHSQEPGASEKNQPMDTSYEQNSLRLQANMPVCENVPLERITRNTGSLFSNQPPVSCPNVETVHGNTSFLPSLNRSTLISRPPSSVSSSADTSLGRAGVSGDDHLRGERNRLMTFRLWPLSARARPEALAKAGFFYMDVGDVVRCVFCRGTLKNWEVGDDPRTEHQKYYPGCPFLLNENVGNVPLDSQHRIVDKVVLPLVNNKAHQNPAGVSQFLPQSTVEGTGMQCLTVRQYTFDHGVLPAGQTAHALAEAGFYHIGPNDTVKCFCCEGALDQWDPSDDPWTEHARWYPECSYLRQKKGVKFVHEVIARFSARRQNTKNQQQLVQPMFDASIEIQAGGTSASGGKEEEKEVGVNGDGIRFTSEESGHVVRMRSSESASQLTTDAMLCKICMEEPMDTVFQPCNHVACCQHCTPGLTICPICRGPILATMRIYLT